MASRVDRYSCIGAVMTTDSKTL